MKILLEDLTPREIVRELDKYIIGQNQAKKIVAIALRNRLRRKRLPEKMRDEIAPKNIIMIGPTGVGKTEIARRLSKLSGAPFLKVEATKYTEVGYVGRDVESMVRDLMSASVSMVRQDMQEQVRLEAEARTEEALLDLLLPSMKTHGADVPLQDPRIDIITNTPSQSTREKFRQKLRDGLLEDKLVEVQVMQKMNPTIEIFSGQSFEEMGMNLGNLSQLMGGKKKKKVVTIRQAREILLAEEMDKLIDTDRVAELAKDAAEQMGIIFIDEIDKIASKENRGGPDVSREGVQRDILPIVEGSTVNTRYGMINTSHILFIAAGAFHISKPSDLIPELQGRFPLRVELEPLTDADFRKILTQPENALTKQYTALLETEGVTITFTDSALERISAIAAEVNSKTENIGARRLHTIMELLLEDISFDAPEKQGQSFEITESYVNEKLNKIVGDQDLSRYIL